MINGQYFDLKVAAIQNAYIFAPLFRAQVVKLVDTLL